MAMEAYDGGADTRGQLIAFDYVMYSNIKRYISEEEKNEEDPEDRDQMFNIVQSITEEYVTKEINTKIEEQNKELSKLFFEEGENCHYLMRKIAK